jgi:hypothetical protein
MNPETLQGGQGKQDRIEGEAWERYLLDLLKGWAADHRRVGKPYRVVDEVRLRGDAYPHWGFEIDFTNTKNGRQVTSRFPIEDWNTRIAAKAAIADILLAVEEGG